MRKDLIWSVFAIAVALVMFVVVAYATDQNPNPVSPVPAGTAQPVLAPGTGPKRPGPADGPRPDMQELPRILMNAALNPRAKNDPEVQALLDKAIADMQIVQQDQVARLAAFQQLVQVARGGNVDDTKKAMEDLNAATQQLRTDAKQVRQDLEPLEKKVRALLPKGISTPETGGRPGNGGNPPNTPTSPPPSEK
jgi:hypothetical protein